MTARLRMPFDPGMNYGRALNEEMELLPEGDWMIALDHDAMWTTPNWHSQIEEAIAFRPEAGLFGAVTNRIAPRWQRAGDRESKHMAHHEAVGHLRLLNNRTLLDVTDTQGLGGVVMVISKEAWRDVGGFADGMRCVDHLMAFAQRDAGRRVYLIESLYVYHRRGTSGDPVRAQASPVAANCPCRGPEEQPTVRIEIPCAA